MEEITVNQVLLLTVNKMTAYIKKVDKWAQLPINYCRPYPFELAPLLLSCGLYPVSWLIVMGYIWFTVEKSLAGSEISLNRTLTGSGKSFQPVYSPFTLYSLHYAFPGLLSSTKA